MVAPNDLSAALQTATGSGSVTSVGQGQVGPSSADLEAQLARLNAEVEILRLVRDRRVQEVHRRLPNRKEYDVGTWVGWLDAYRARGILDHAVESTFVRSIRVNCAYLLLNIVSQTVDEKMRAIAQYRDTRRRYLSSVPRAYATTAAIRTAIQGAEAKVSKHTAFKRAIGEDMPIDQWRHLIDGCLEYEAGCRDVIVRLADEMEAWESVRRGQIQARGAEVAIWLAATALLVDLCFEHGPKILSAVDHVVEAAGNRLVQKGP